MPVTIETTAALDAWLAAEAEILGLDASTFARMLLFRSMNGGGQRATTAAPAPPRTAVAQPPAPADDVVDEAEFYDDEVETLTLQRGADIEALVAQRVAAELARRAEERMQRRADEDENLCVRAVKRGPMPAYGGATDAGRPTRIQRTAYGA